MIQLIVVQPITSSQWTQSNLKPGDVAWVRDPVGARHLIEHGICKLPEAAPQPPADPEKPRILRRSDSWPLDRFAVIDPAWKGQPVVCIGGGPSVTREAVNLCKGRARVIAINDAYRLAPWADVCYFADARWWEWHKDKPAFKEFAGQKVTIGEETGALVADAEVFMLHNFGKVGLSETPNGLHTGANGGYQAVNIATLAGGNPILLLGYDMRFQGRKSHWHEGHPLKTPEGAYSNYARKFDTMLPQLKRLGIRVINCTPGSLIKAFPFGDLASLLPHP